MRAVLLLAIGLALQGCKPLQVNEEIDEEGVKSASSFLHEPDGSMTRHGLQRTWYPEGGKKTMEIFVHGRLEGYSFHWHPNGQLGALEHYSDGVRNGEARFWDDSGNLTACRTAEGEDCLSSGLPMGSDLASRPTRSGSPSSDPARRDF